jgi:hypothetical protein
LHDLTIAVQRVTKNTFLWTEAIGLRNKRVHFVSDKSIMNEPNLLLKVHQSLVEACGLILLPQGDGIYKIIQKGEEKPRAQENEGFAEPDGIQEIGMLILKGG